MSASAANALLGAAAGGPRPLNSLGALMGKARSSSLVQEARFTSVHKKAPEWRHSGAFLRASSVGKRRFLSAFRQKTWQGLRRREAALAFGRTS